MCSSDLIFFLSDKVPEYLLKTEKKYKDIDWRYNLVNFLPNYNPFSKIDVDEKCCIVRDPLERFISAYKNRILFHKDRGFKDHNIDEIIEKLENNMFEKHVEFSSYPMSRESYFFLPREERVQRAFRSSWPFRRHLVLDGDEVL